MRIALEEGCKEGQADEVIAMAMGNQERHVQSSAPRAPKILPQPDDPRARIQDQRMGACLHLNTRCIAPWRTVDAPGVG